MAESGPQRIRFEHLYWKK